MPAPCSSQNTNGATEFYPHPLYSPVLEPHDFHLFRTLKYDISHEYFRTDDKFKQAVLNWLRNAGDFYFTVMKILL